MSKQAENISCGNQFLVTDQVITWELQQRTNRSSANPPENICSDAFDLVAKPHLGSAFAEGSRNLAGSPGKTTSEGGWSVLERQVMKGMKVRLLQWVADNQEHPSDAWAQDRPDGSAADGVDSIEIREIRCDDLAKNIFTMQSAAVVAPIQMNKCLA
ncbi:hypothetical protein llap_11968 [Limosa lapponica baueri]|uniref:Uncharacterized protein n=1 Tax=Limosa lapponica baueri TaxID=1758121 RepID=A0A2I0TV99_LIMLA|nr:hypothetical protein llap_11968 [Limosa lapponica baueri]